MNLLFLVGTDSCPTRAGGSSDLGATCGADGAFFRRGSRRLGRRSGLAVAKDVGEFSFERFDFVFDLSGPSKLFGRYVN